MKPWYFYVNIEICFFQLMRGAFFLVSLSLFLLGVRMYLPNNDMKEFEGNILNE